MSEHKDPMNGLSFADVGKEFKALENHLAYLKDVQGRSELGRFLAICLTEIQKASAIYHQYVHKV